MILDFLFFYFCRIFGRRRRAIRMLLSMRVKAQEGANKRILSWCSNRLQSYGLFIARGAIVPSCVNFPHPTGIVIGEGVKIEGDVHIFQNVTLGGARFGDSRDKRHPRICEGATIFSGAAVLGPVIIGKGALVGANAVVLHNVPAEAIAVGVPARVLTGNE